AAAAARPARGMRAVPRLRSGIVAQTLAIDVTDHRGTLGAAGPVPTGAILAGGESLAVRLRAGQHVVIVRRIADAGDHGAALGQRRLRAELVVIAVQVIDVLRDHLALEVLPRALADAVASIDRLGATGRLRAEIGVPGLAAGPCALRQGLAMA